MPGEQKLMKPFLSTLKAEDVPVSIYLVNGIKLQGKIEAFDEQVIMLKNSFSQIIFKHAISTVVPMRKVLLEGFDTGEVHVAVGTEGISETPTETT